MTVADAIADWLAAREIRCAFGIVGAGNLPLWDAITRKAATKIVCCHHEQAAALAAAGYYRASGKIALLLVTTGAGSSNALTGVLSAYMDSIPVLVLSGNEPSRYMSAKTRVLGVQGYASSFVASHMTKFAAQFTAMPILDVAYSEALRPRMGPVWVDVSRDIAASQA